MTSATPAHQPVSTGRWALLGAHAAVVATLTAGAVIFIADTPAGWGATDATFGLALFALPLLVLGLPWSLAYPVVLFGVGLFSRGDDPAPQRFAADLVVALAMLAPAVVNVVLHARWLLARHRQQ